MDVKARIRNAGFMVRHYIRPIQRAQRRQAIIALGVTVREAFNDAEPEDFEELLAAILDALHPRDERRF